MTTSRSQSNSSCQSPQDPSFDPLCLRFPPQPSQAYPLSQSQRHLSLSHSNVTKSISQSISHHPESERIPLPLDSPHDLWAQIQRPPAIVIHHSTPELISDSEPPTPTSYGPPVPDKDFQYLSPRLVSSVPNLQIQIFPPSPDLPRVEPQSPTFDLEAERAVSVEYDTSGSLYSYPPSMDESGGTARGRWNFWRIRSRDLRDDVGIASGESRTISHPSAGSRALYSPRETDENAVHVWVPEENGDEGAWRAV